MRSWAALPTGKVVRLEGAGPLPAVLDSLPGEAPLDPDTPVPDDPGPLEETPYESTRPKLPRSLMESVAALKQSGLFREQFGDQFVDYIVALKESGK